ncbi:hypothetical protein Cpir12675_005209 [Ceratocystis pirilliformis]|uniref:Non-structural maintenance of chromosomes element 4 n=1 Tax=Ceratocystis pirilliformis TaxID=259994 RepID=A0ABR3YSN5_9PEZI
MPITHSDSENDYNSRRDSLAIRHSATGKRRRTHRPPPTEDDDSNADADTDPTNIYDPDQPIEERRAIQRGLRELSRQLVDQSDEFLKPSSNGLRTVLQDSNRINQDIRQTTEAAIDSRLLVTVADLSYRKTVRLMQGSAANGLDIDDFIAKAIRYMRHGHGIPESADGAGLTLTQHHRRQRTSAVQQAGDGSDADEEAAICRGQDEDEEDESGDMLNWDHLGRYAALPASRRAPSTAFLLGPLHAEKKVRKIGKRSAPLRIDALHETRPEVLNTEDLAKVDNDLTVICARILNVLGDTQQRIQDTLEELLEDDISDEERVRLMHEHGLRSTGGVDLMRFVVNPQSYAQTVENMFYVSFLIRDGKVAVEFDDDGLPSLSPVESQDIASSGHSADARHQAIFTLDKHTWNTIVQALEITSPMIEHREAAVPSSGPGARGWYS